MEESQFHFNYTWADMRPIRPLAVAMVAGQLIGAISGCLLSPFMFVNIFIGAALFTFIGFIVGCIIQGIYDLNKLKEHIVLVRRLGLISLFLFGIAVMFFLERT